MEKEQQNRAVYIVIILVIALIALTLVVFIRATPYGVGLVSDSVNYINGARSIAEGQGYFRQSGGGTLKPITNFPPLYSMILSIPIAFGMDGIAAAWWVSLIFFTANLIVIVELVWKGSGSPWAGFFAGLFFLTLRPYLYFQFYAMSEPVFFFFTLLAFLELVRGFRKNRLRCWFMCGIACGCAFLARYIGIVSLCAVLAAMLLFLRKRKGVSIALVLCGSLPLVVSWLLRNLLVSGSASNRRMLNHWVTGEDLKHGVMIFWRWIYPQRYEHMETPAPWMTTAVIVALLIGLAFIFLSVGFGLAGKKQLPTSMVICWTYCLFIIGYLAFVILTISLFDASVNIEERILFPAFMVGLLLLISVVGIIGKNTVYIFAALPLSLVIFMGFCFADDTLEHIPEMAERGYGWGWEGWALSPAMNIVKDLPDDKIIYTNQPEAISLWAEKGAYALVDPIDPSSETRREGYDESMTEIRRQVTDGESVLVLFGVETWVDGSPDNWVTELCRDLPYIYQDTSEWVVGSPD